MRNLIRKTVGLVFILPMIVLFVDFFKEIFWEILFAFLVVLYFFIGLLFLFNDVSITDRFI